MMTHDIIVNARFRSRAQTGVERYGAEILQRIGERVRIVQPEWGLQGTAGHFWEQFILPLLVHPKAVLWSPANTGPLSLSNQVLSLHDLTPLESPEWYQASFSLWYRIFLPRLIRRVRRVVVPSEYIRQKVLARFSLPAEQAITIPCGVDTNRFQPGERYLDQTPYLLFVGTLQPRKNLPVLLNVWGDIKKRYPGQVLVIAGAAGRSFQRVHLPGSQDQVRYTGYVPEAELPRLYAGATAFVFPSLDEGFGLPLMEAMASGVPVIASRAGAIPEVVGDAALLFDPNNPTELACELCRCLDQPELRSTLRLSGLERAKIFSWDTCAQRIWQVLEEAHAA